MIWRPGLGVFLDEVINGWDSHGDRIPWYKDHSLTRSAVRTDWTVIATNTGSNISQAMCDLDFDVCMMFEGTATKFLQEDPTSGSQHRTRPEGLSDHSMVGSGALKINYKFTRRSTGIRRTTSPSATSTSPTASLLRILKMVASGMMRTRTALRALRSRDDNFTWLKGPCKLKLRGYEQPPIPGSNDCPQA